MARTIAEIKKSITDAFISNDTVKNAYVLDPAKTFEEEFSTSSIESIIFYAVAFCMWVHEMLFDQHKQEVTDYIANMKPHSLLWYANKSKAFMYGLILPADTDKYVTTAMTDEQIEAAKVVDHAAVVEQIRGLRIKVATDTGSDLGPLSAPQLDSFIAYMKRVKDAGVKLLITTGPPDALKLNLLVKYDPLVLNSTGARLDGTQAEPVQDAVRNYLKNLPFNGRLELVKLVDELQAVNGVVAPYVLNAQARYGILPFTSFPNMVYTPDAGYLRIYDPTDLTITFEANE